MSMNVTKKWFTLIEILIVVVIISLLLSFVMSFSWSQISELRQKKETETFKDLFNSLITKNINSNYINKRKYESLTINIEEWKKDIYTKYISNDEIINTWTMTNPFVENVFENLYINYWNPVNTISIKTKPYTMWCSINNSNEDASFQIRTATKVLCFNINHKTCQIKEKKCED